MQPLITILIGLVLSYHFTDVESENAFYSLVCPIGIFIFLCALAIWLVQRFASGLSSNSSGDGGAGIGGSSDHCGGDGGDCGGGGD